MQFKSPLIISNLQPSFMHKMIFTISFSKIIDWWANVSEINRTAVAIDAKLIHFNNQ